MAWITKLAVVGEGQDDHFEELAIGARTDHQHLRRDQRRGPCRRRPAHARQRGSPRPRRSHVEMLADETPPINRIANNRCGQAAKTPEPPPMGRSGARSRPLETGAALAISALMRYPALRVSPYIERQRMRIVSRVSKRRRAGLRERIVARRGRPGAEPSPEVGAPAARRR